MSATFDTKSQGKRIYDLRTLVADIQHLTEDVIYVFSNGAGPRILLCGGIHGDEYESQIVLRELSNTLNSSEIRGLLIIIPTINPSASQNGFRVSPEDGKNMNRVFPGNANGSITERMAAFLHDQVFPNIDLLVDVHAGGADYFVIPMIFGFTSPQCSLNEEALESLMDRSGYPVVEYVQGIASTAVCSAPLTGVASLEIEGGGGTAVKAEELSCMRTNILRVLYATGVMMGDAPAATPLRVDVSAENDHVAPHVGIIEHRVALMDRVEAGDLLAVLHPSAGRSSQVTEIRAKGAGIVLRQRAKFFVRQGELICNTGTLR